ncbi:hypothetical protein BMR1_03g03355 [Babesia microti strain RI]|uniref:Uncharacterized protein n=1 Tax=Babesia microti (strain RI) TaxID=1133968 RepID=A0A0K3AUK1_BABMR|nr:hypothetical protein BMR1_03g03355 [Babesia microti strain RI]CTQ41271.1 hypothetical protein BMR1_03g03355 [Babesia microti strain RI]|eukprot:XP_012649282.1 hypothetical protein BMR1_03g03355 [Babesia microti strain RI]
MEGDKYTKLKTALLKLPRNELMTLLEVTYKAMKNKYGLESNTANHRSYTNHSPGNPNIEASINLNFGSVANSNEKNIGNKNVINTGVMLNTKAIPMSKSNPTTHGHVDIVGSTNLNSNPINTKNFIVDKGFDCGSKLVDKIPMDPKKMANMQPLVPQNRTILKRKVVPTYSQTNLVQPLPAAAASFAPQKKL